jgi:hypothetical protein
MVTAKDFRRIALSLDGTSAAPHFDRTAFKVRRIYATLAGDGETANLMFTPEEQALKCTVAPDAFSALPNAWGVRGATCAKLAALMTPELRAALVTAWRRAADLSPSRMRKRRGKSSGLQRKAANRSTYGQRS